jgi:hypothetical protein
MANSKTIYKPPDGRAAENVTEDKTLAIEHQGVVQNVIADGLNITLPATVVGYIYTIRNGGVPKTGGAAGTGDDGSAIVKITPNSGDLIAGMELTASDADSINNTKATARVGDEITLLGNGTTGWNIVSIKGTWAQIAI